MKSREMPSHLDDCLLSMGLWVKHQQSDVSDDVRFGAESGCIGMAAAHFRPIALKNFCAAQ
jgi:hypothetical protein